MSPNPGRLAPYAPRIATEWDLDAPGSLWQPVDGTLVFVDISGFTALSERLARLGRQGAEELTMVLDTVFGSMLRSAYARGGSLLKFGGDALLLLFESDDHVMQATAAAVEMRATLRTAKEIETSVGRVDLRMSVGLHTGTIDFFMVGDTHRELIVTGPTASNAEHMEGTADAGEIVVSPELAEHLPGGFVGDRKGDGYLLRKRKVDVGPAGLVRRRVEGDDAIAPFVPSMLRTHLQVGSLNEHRIATIGFVRVSGVDTMLATDGPEATAEAIDEATRAIQAATDREGITYLASDLYPDGWKVIIIGGVPTSQPDDEGRVLRAGRQIIEAGTRLPVRVGVNRGHVFSGDVGTEVRRSYTIMGDAVNLAARVMAACTPGQMRATPEALDRAATLFETTAMEPFAAKGKSEPVHTFAVGEERGSRPLQEEGELPFGGRDDELGALEDLLARARAGTGGAVTLVGDTGQGKTRLLTKALEGPKDLRLLVSRGEPTGRDTPYRAIRDGIRGWFGVERGPQADMAAALQQAIADLAPDMAWAAPLVGDIAHIEIDDTPETALIEPRFRADRAADAVADLLGRTDETIAVVADDAHWTDEATIGLIDRLARDADELPRAVLMAMRPSGDAPDPIGETIELTPLADEAVVDIIHEATAAAPLRPEDVSALVTRAGGNPLFLSELVRVVRSTGSAENLPDTLEAVVSADIDALPELAKRLLRISSVLGRSFRRTVLDEFLEPEQVELDQATRRALAPFVEADGRTRWRFRHAVVHDLAYNSLPYRRRRALHARAARVMERAAKGEVEPIAGILAIHFAEAGEHERAWELARVAGDRAKAEYANTEAAGQYRRALAAARHIDPPPRNEIPAVAEALGDVLEQAGFFEDALTEFSRASQATDDPVFKARIMMKRARAHVRIGSYSTAVRQTTIGRRLVADLRAEEASVAHSQLVALASGIRLQQGRPRLALPLAEEARDLAKANGDRDALARAYTVLDGALEMLGRPDEARYGALARSIYEELGDTPGVATVDNNFGVRAYDEGRWDDAVDDYSRAQEGFRRSGNLPQAALCGANIGEVLVSQGRLEEAEPILEDAMRTIRAAGFIDLAIFAEIQLARLETARGDVDSARERLARLHAEAVDLGQRDVALEAALYLADAMVAQDQAQAALELLDRAEASAGEEAALFEASLHRVRARANLNLGRVAQARSLASHGLELARDQGLPYEEALLLGISGRASGSPDDLEKANRLLQGLGVRISADV